MRNTYDVLKSTVILDKQLYYTKNWFIIRILENIMYAYDFELITQQERDELIKILYQNSGISTEDFITLLKRTKYRIKFYRNNTAYVYTITSVNKPYDTALSKSFKIEEGPMKHNIVYFESPDDAKFFINNSNLDINKVRIIPVVIDGIVSRYKSDYGPILLINED